MNCEEDSEMIDLEKLKNASFLQIVGNNFFGFTRYCKDGIGEVHSIKMFGKNFYLNKSIRRLSRHRTSKKIL